MEGKYLRLWLFDIWKGQSQIITNINENLEELFRESMQWITYKYTLIFCDPEISPLFTFLRNICTYLQGDIYKNVQCSDVCYCPE